MCENWSKTFCLQAWCQQQRRSIGTKYMLRVSCHTWKSFSSFLSLRRLSSFFLLFPLIIISFIIIRLNGESEWHEESECWVFAWRCRRDTKCLDEDFFREEDENFANKSVLFGEEGKSGWNWLYWVIWCEVIVAGY